MFAAQCRERDAASRSPVFRSKGRPEEETGTMGYGNIMHVETTGASEETAWQDRLGYSGVGASHKMAQTDSDRMAKYRSIINAVGRNKGVDPALIAAIISRESRAGKPLVNGWGDRGRAFGLMQIDPHNSGLTPVGAWDSEAHLSQATDHLIYFIGVIRKKFSEWRSDEKWLKGALAAYNMGDQSVRSYENVDVETTGGDYSNDVVARAQWYKRNGF